MALYSILALVIAATLISRYVVGILVHDQAELVVYSQTLSWTYDEQMPVLTWLTTLLLNITSYFILVPDIVKYAGVVAAVIVIFRMTQTMTGSGRAGFIAATAMFLIPTMNEDMLREYTHTASLIAFSVGSFAFFIGRDGLRMPTSLVFLALVWAGGLLSKYTMLLIMAGQIGAFVFLIRPPRETIVRLLVAALGAVAIASPIYLLMVFNQAPVQTGLSEFLATGEGSRRLAGMIDFASSMLMEGGLMFLALWIAGSRLGKTSVSRAQPGYGIIRSERFFLVSTAMVLGLFCVVILVANVDVVRDRWLAPAMIMLAPVAASWFSRAHGNRTNLLVAVFLGIWLIAFGTMRAAEPFIDGATGEYSVENHPYTFIADEALVKAAGHDAILSNSAHFAATLKAREPRLRVYAPKTQGNIPADAASILIVSTFTRADNAIVLGAEWQCDEEEMRAAPLRFARNATFPYGYQVCHKEYQAGSPAGAPMPPA
ncbi:hypothetical protein GCM10011342_09940 [Aquisalinus flavus]|uniref:Glycosyltransferase RgtA/B/C/D-like domain-containing protein n=2 Tax=Aquisalinus flavus TaxID=1526572 RepID=A0A8J2V181_9PROT|nr:hypothetical protein GCM10011342_09940 [Aquisalinus flavus]